MQTVCTLLLSIILWQSVLLQDISFTIKNNSEHAVVLYIGKTTVSIQRNASYRFSKPVGTQIFLVEFGEKTTLLLTVKENLAGKKLNFLDLIKKE